MKTRKFLVADREMTITEVRVLILELYCDHRMQVADILGNSIHTIETHLRNIKDRYDLKGHRGLFRFGYEHDFLKNGFFRGEFMFEDDMDRSIFESEHVG